MVILDTDHLTLIQFPGSSAAISILTRLTSIGIQQVITTIITYEEQTRGWLKEVAGAKDLTREIAAYHRLTRNLDDFRAIRVLDFGDQAAVELQKLRRLKLRVGAMDLKIAAITLAHDATLLSRNRRDFEKVPGLRVEDWSA